MFLINPTLHLVGPLLLAIVCVLPTLASEDARSRGFLDRVHAIRKKGDVESVQKLIAILNGEWGEKKDAGYYRLIVELCRAVSSWPAREPNREDLIRDIAIKALDAPGEKTIETEVNLLLYLQGDADYIQGKVGDAKWAKERLVRVRRWLGVWQRLGAEKNTIPGAIGPIKANVWPPPGPGVTLPGFAPETIKDPKRRKQYEEAIARNAETARLHRLKRDFDDLENLFLSPAKRYIVKAYCNPPLATEELEAILEQHGIDEATRSAMVEEVRRRSAQRTELEAKYAKLGVVKGYLDLSPKTGPGADPRLRVPITADFKVPKAEEVLEKLREATGVTLTRADEIQNESYVAGSYSFSQVPAWRVMDTLASSKYVEGQWQKDGDGYRLVPNGKPIAEYPAAAKAQAKGPAAGAPASRQGSSGFLFWLSILSGVAIALIAAVIVWKRWRKVGEP